MQTPHCYKLFTVMEKVKYASRGCLSLPCLDSLQFEPKRRRKKKSTNNWEKQANSKNSLKLKITRRNTQCFSNAI